MVSPIKHGLKTKILLVFVLALSVKLFLPAGETGAISCFAQSKKIVRVAVLEDTPSLSLKVQGRYEIIDSATQKILSRGRNLKTTVTTHKNEILLGRVTSQTPRLVIKTEGSGIIIINGRRFRQDMELIKKDNAGILVVNHIDLEDYIKGILYHEASHYWPLETLKAQAIASRTYAVYQMQENGLKDYDLTCDTYSQVYGGSTSERYRTNEAVGLTRHEVLTYRGKVFPAYFHATCAGHTEDAAVLWNINIAPLRGVRCNFCKDSPHINWHYVLTLDEIKEKLINAGYDIGQIKNMVILGRDNSGRVTDLSIVSTKENLKISAKNFRHTIGPNIIRSTNFTVTVINNDAVFEGRGWGHGVGLCQWGAYFMGKQGYNVKQILEYYYPGANVETIGF